MKWRITSLFFIFGILYLSLIFKIYNLQIEKGDSYLIKAESLRRLSGVFQTPRGAIYFTDRNNNSNIAAFNKDYQVIFNFIFMFSHYFATRVNSSLPFVLSRPGRCGWKYF